MTGLIDLIRTYNLQENDILLFTYYGDGRFDILIFDSSKVEKCLTTNADDTCNFFFVLITFC